ncbi:MAG: HprK-related kinase B [Syntrophobacteraceae bacterium]
MRPAPGFHEILGSYIKGAYLSDKIGLAFGGVRIDVCSNSTALTDGLADYYEEFEDDAGAPLITVNALEREPVDLDIPLIIKEREPGKTQLKEAYLDLPEGRIVHKVRTGMVFAFGKGDHYALGPCIRNLPQVVNFINNRYIEYVLNQGALLFHAAAVSLNNASLAISGFAGAGKSTLALELMGPGMDFLSNDRLMVRKDDDLLTMYGVPKMPRVNPGTILNNPKLRPILSPEELARFEALPPTELWTLEHKFDALIPKCYGHGRFKLKAPMAGLVVLTWKRDGGAMVVREVDLRERRDLMPAFMKDVGLFFEPEDPEEGLDFSQEAYLDLLEHCPVYEITGGVDFKDATRWCSQWLAHHRSS